MREPVGASGEDRLIARYFKPLAKDPRALGLIDDCAVMTPPPGHELVLKTDAVVGGVHFLSDDPPETVARKALRVNLSDLAAKGAEPIGFLLTLALPADLPERMDRRVRARPRRGCGRVRLSAARRRYRAYAGPGDGLDRHLGTVPSGTMVTRQARRPAIMWSSPARSATRR